jgi:hypothetical protein
VRAEAKSSPPFGLLVWLLETELFTDDDLDMLDRTHVEELAFATNATRKRTIDEFLAITQDAVAARRHKLMRQFWAQLLPGPRWAWMVGVRGVFVFAAWYTFAPAGTPACGAVDVKRNIASGLFEAYNKQGHFFDRSEKRLNMLGAELNDVKEVGYVDAERSRGCSATLEVDDVQMPVAYTVGPGRDGSGLWVAGGDPRVIGAKHRIVDFGRLCFMRP